MASILNADNGVVSGTSGLKYASDNSGVIELQTSGATTLTLNTSKNAVFANAANVTGVLNAGNTTITGTLSASANVNFDSGTFFVDGTNNRIGINNTAPTQALTVTGTAGLGNTTISGTQFVNGAVTFANSTSNTVIFAANGSVGIGTDAIGSGIKLDVQGGEIRAGRIDANSEGGQISLARSTDNATAWYADVYGNTSTPSFRLVDVSSAAVSLAINSSGAVALRGGVSASGVGITFPSGQSASSDANTLDDYEEGSYTPTLIVTSGTPSYNYATAYYTKIGRQVFGGGIIGIGNSASLGGPIRVSLPFTALALSNGYTGGFSSDGSGWTYPISSGSSGNIYSVEWQINSGNAFMTFTPAAANAAEIPYTATGIANSWYIRFSFSFYTS